MNQNPSIRVGEIDLGKCAGCVALEARLREVENELRRVNGRIALADTWTRNEANFRTELGNRFSKHVVEDARRQGQLRRRVRLVEEEVGMEPRTENRERETVDFRLRHLESGAIERDW